MFSHRFFSYWFDKRDEDGDLAFTSNSKNAKTSVLCHRFIVEPFAAVMASSRSADSPQGFESSETFVLEGATADDLKRLVDFFYNRGLPLENASHESVERLVKFSKLLQAPLLLQICQEWKSRNIVPDQVWEILGDALEDKDRDTENKCLQLLSILPQQFDPNEERMKNIKEAAVLEILKQNQLPITEMKLFLFIKSYFNARKNLKDEVKEELLRRIRFPTMSKEFLATTVKNSGLLKTDDYLTLCEILAGVASHSEASRFCSMKREKTPTVTLITESGDKFIVGYQPKESFAHLKQKLKLYFKQETMISFQDKNEVDIKNSTEIKKYSKAPVRIVRNLLLHFVLDGHEKISIPVVNNENFATIKTKLLLHLGNPTLELKMIFGMISLRDEDTPKSAGVLDGEEITLLQISTCTPSYHVEDPFDLMSHLRGAEGGKTTKDQLINFFEDDVDALPEVSPRPSSIGDKERQPDFQRITVFNNMSQSSSKNSRQTCKHALRGEDWVSGEKTNPTQPEWIEFFFTKAKVVKRIIFQIGSSPTEAPEKVEIFGGMTKKKEKTKLLEVDGIISKNEDKILHAIDIPNSKAFNRYTIKICMTYGQSIGSKMPYVTVIKDLQVYGY